MANIYEWLEDTHQPSYAPTSPPFGPMDGNPFDDVLMDQATLLDTDEYGNMYFEMPHVWNKPVEHQANVESLPIDPSLRIRTESFTPTISGDRVVTIPEHLVETSRKILIYLTQVLELPGETEDLDNETTEEMVLTADEMEALEPIDEEEFEPITPDDIDGIRVNMSPRSTEIKEIIDLRRIGLDRQTFYLARSVQGTYYWFYSPQAGRDGRLRQLIGDYRRKSRAAAVSRGTHGVKRLRSGKTIRI